MRTVILTLCLGLSLTFVSCQDWLDVDPKSEMKWDVMFETEQGFKDALIGCYATLSERNLYGGEMTCLFLDVLAQQYYAPQATSSSYQTVFTYTYTSTQVTNKIDAIWTDFYNVLANVNSIIEAVELHGEVMSPTVRSLIKAEAYALRGYIYLDLVRLFTWGDLADRPDREEKLAGLAIPYAKVYDKDIVPQETLENVLQYIHEDLEIAVDLFLNYSPQSKLGTRPDDYEEIPEEDTYFSTDVTKYRMNVTAAIATRMRLNLWEGNYRAAYDDANLLRTTYNLTWISLSDLPATETNQDLTFSKEMLFGLQAYERFDNVIDPYFRRLTENGLNNNSQFLCLPSERAAEIYERAAGLADPDWRYIYWWREKAESTYAFNKFYEVENMVNTNNIPLIKSPEICYTEAECLLRMGGESNRTDAITLLNLVRSNRGLSATPLPNSLSASEVYDELTKEWRKEFVGDGQLFFYYKRIGSESIPYTSVVCDDEIYVLPLPQDEIDFGGRVDLIERD